MWFFSLKPDGLSTTLATSLQSFANTMKTLLRGIIGLVVIFGAYALIALITNHEAQLQNEWEQLSSKEQKNRTELKDKLVVAEEGHTFITVEYGNEAWTGIVKNRTRSGVQVLPGPQSRDTSTVFISYGYPIRGLGSDMQVTKVLNPGDSGWSKTAEWYFTQ